MEIDAIIVGGGVAGLTAAAYLAKAGLHPVLLEKESNIGGLVNSFTRDGFTFDGGIRALENSGVLFPMLKDLGIQVEMVHNLCSLGIEDQVVRLTSERSLKDYQTLLEAIYPDSKTDIEAIINQISMIMSYMKVQYGIDNPLFMDVRKNPDYLVKVLLPWLVKYALTVPKITALNKPVENFLQQYTHNQSLLDIISQHFFHETPAFFALSYLKLYLDYNYPIGGTGKFVEKLADFITEHGGEICTGVEIRSVDPHSKTLFDAMGNEYAYRRLIWAADQKTFYRILDLSSMANGPIKQAIDQRQIDISNKVGNDSVYTVYLAVDMDQNFFAKIASEHFFYTPRRLGQSQAGPIPSQVDRPEIESWLQNFFSLTTYEISIPVMRDVSLAPPGKTGLIVSVLFDYKLTKYIEETGWYDDFKSLCESYVIDTLDSSIYPGIKRAILNQFSSTPLTMQKLAGNSDGAITGWAFSNHPMPAESRLPKIMNAITTPVPGVYQAGQWTYSPAGLPISIITGKIAADRVIKDLVKKH